ncbi:DEAD/DEAH box helicase [Rapidithrix thailandica]|uniref:DEAD/DEAH box helicase n=1 Tax=Rapidithrix thailandica TaxID=413964 RepID=A0AAW9RZ63_9BACT
MEVSTDRPFQIVYSLFEHQFLGYLFESFVVQLDDLNRLTLQHQNISSHNAKEFANGLDEIDYQLIKLMDAMQPESIIKKFFSTKKVIKKNDFFLNVYHEEKGDKTLQAAIAEYMEEQRSKILKLLPGKYLFEMGNDGEPTYKQLHIQEGKATVLFHFMRNEENTHYFPTIKFAGKKLEFQYKGGIVICNKPAWLMVENHIYSFAENVDGSKLKPFLNKRFIVIPKKLEETYYKKFIVNVVQSYDVHAKGFEILNVDCQPSTVLSLTEVGKQQSLPLNGNGNGQKEADGEKIILSLQFAYKDFMLNGQGNEKNSVKLIREGNDYIFYKIKRNQKYESEKRALFKTFGLNLQKGKIFIEKSKAFEIITQNAELLKEQQIEIQQNSTDKVYFIGNSEINLEIKENKDWFDVHAIVRFGEFEIPFVKLRKLILSGKKEFMLPNGEVAVIPESWFSKYADLFHFIEDAKDSSRLKKYHLSLVEELKTGNLAKVTIDRKLEQLKIFEQINEYSMPNGFQGQLRPYQKAGYNWLCFLNDYNFGGCLADDMGLGKTVQTLALLQKEKAKESVKQASLLIMPTSLLYNWEMEAKKFTPELKVFSYIGTNREKNVENFDNYDLVLTSYGITRIDVELLEQYYFNYVILDESQVIKNPESNIARSVLKLKSKKRLILTGTPIENTTMDLWSQMHFVNPGLLGTQGFFKRHYQQPIERLKNEERTKKLHTIIKPFILRRHKSQVATELPEKIEKVQFCNMSEKQEKLYEETKSYYRNKILQQIEDKGVSGSQFMLLQGLTLLRQLANHPKMVNQDYEADSGKLNDILHALDNAIGKDHKILIFSQFVKHLQIIREHLEEENVPYCYLDGSTKNRKEQVDQFQNNPDMPVFLISLKAGGLGLNLTAADYVFILDPWWNPAIENQAVDRAHRIGQKKTVFTYKFITKNSVEEKILALQESKMKLANDLITTEESFVKNLTKDDIESLLA